MDINCVLIMSVGMKLDLLTAFVMSMGINTDPTNVPLLYPGNQHVSYNCARVTFVVPKLQYLPFMSLMSLVDLV